MDWLLVIVLFFFVIVVTAVMFCAWLAVTMIRVTFRAVGALFSPPDKSQIGQAPFRPVVAKSSQTLRCPTHGCGALNPASARFCRRCGRGLPAAQRVQVRRAAVW
jgi:hypothetical protein